MDESDNVIALRPRTEGTAGPAERLPDSGLRQLCIEWIRKSQEPNVDAVELCRIGNGIIDTPATSTRGVFYKVAAAAATAECILAHDHPIGLFLLSAIDDDQRLEDQR